MLKAFLGFLTSPKVAHKKEPGGWPRGADYTAEVPQPLRLLMGLRESLLYLFLMAVQVHSEENGH